MRSVSSQAKGLQINVDGSVDVHFRTEVPAGKEKHWIQSITGKGWKVWAVEDLLGRRGGDEGGTTRLPAHACDSAPTNHSNGERSGQTVGIVRGRRKDILSLNRHEVLAIVSSHPCRRRCPARFARWLHMEPFSRHFASGPRRNSTAREVPRHQSKGSDSCQGRRMTKSTGWVSIWGAPRCWLPCKISVFGRAVESEGRQGPKAERTQASLE
jgi:hypothetical protein